MSEEHADLRGAAEVMQALDRLADRGLAKREPRGINDDGMQTLADLLAVLTFQTGNGPSHAERVGSATSRAMLAALGDLYAEISGRPTTGTETLQLLAAAVREARATPT